MNLISKALRYGPITKGSHSFTCHPREPYLNLLCKHSPDGATLTEVGRHLIAAYYSFINPEQMKG